MMYYYHYPSDQYCYTWKRSKCLDQGWKKSWFFLKIKKSDFLI